MHIPKSFLAKILQRLVRSDMAKSVRRRPSGINLFDIIEFIQGHTTINLCAVDHRLCSMSKTCVVHPIWVKIRLDIEKSLKDCSTTRPMKRRHNFLAGVRVKKIGRVEKERPGQ